MILDEEAYLAHYGILRKSGRYPWGSGGTQVQRNRTFLEMVEERRHKGMSEKEIAEDFGLTTTQLRGAKTIAINAEKQANIAMAQRLKDKGLSNVAIGERMGINESSVRSLLAPGQKDRANILNSTTNMLKQQVAEHKYIDIGAGVEHHLQISDSKLRSALSALEEEGYTKHYVQVEQLGTGNKTTIRVLAAPGTDYSEVYKNRAQIKFPNERTEDGGRTFLGISEPLSIAPSRVKVRYANEGGADSDGVIYVRPGVNDISLGGSRYAQVRIKVGDSHYLKGMAVYKDDLPAGVDLEFNTNKNSTGNKLDAMKKLKDDPDNPFGAVVSQIGPIGPGGKRKVTSAMNLVNEEGDWTKWSKSLSSQFLSKQSPALAKEQLTMVQERRKKELDEILALTNPVVRKKLLESFADGADSASVSLKAAALPRTINHVILPMNFMKENEIYAPNYNDGDRVVLIRHPHGGIFEIPELVVNNRNAQARKALGNAPDAVGIHSKVAARLSGADFDGDTVLVIPNNNRKVKTAPSLTGLKDFDPQASYAPYHGMKTIDGGTYNAETRSVDYGGKKPSTRAKGIQMGDVSNLITDMTIRGATTNELARAVRHSMVVIDAEKHSLNYKLSAEVNGIKQLKAKYQGGPNAGASTLISRASAEIRVPERKPRPQSKGGPVDKQTGQRVFVDTGATFVDKKGVTQPKTRKSEKLAETQDAHTLSSGTTIEKIYADHSNQLKSLANRARKEAVNTEIPKASSSAKVVYAKEAATLNSKLNVALKNAPLERRAQTLANDVVTQKKQANPNLDPSELKRLKFQALEEARAKTGAKKTRIQIEPPEWEAIQAGAIAPSKLSAILNNTDIEVVKKYATPKEQLTMTPVKQQRARTMLNAGYTQAEVAQALGVGLTTLKDSL